MTEPDNTLLVIDIGQMADWSLWRWFLLALVWSFASALGTALVAPIQAAGKRLSQRRRS